MTEPEQYQVLASAAKQAAANAYCIYSNFPVGAALLLQDGSIIAGCNVENGCYPLGNCAERTALFTAVAKGYTKADMAALFIYTPTQTPCPPCGACRQVISEFLSPDIKVTSCCDSDQFKTWQVAELLPDSFSLHEQR